MKLCQIILSKNSLYGESLESWFCYDFVSEFVAYFLCLSNEKNIHSNMEEKMRKELYVKQRGTNEK